MKRVGMALACAVLLVIVQLPGRAEGGAAWHWRRSSNPFKVKLIDSVSATWDEAFRTRAKQWSRGATVLDFVVKQGDETIGMRYACPEVRGAVRVCNYGYGFNGWAGLTTFTLDQNNHILAVTVKLNESETPSSHFRAVACHELGHALGLDHRDQAAQKTSCMTPLVHSYQKLPDKKDFANLAKMYSHLDGSSSASVADVEHVESNDDGTKTVTHILPAPR